jgi:hypothetical protein
MSAWMGPSPYSSIGIYIGGVNRGCPNTALNTPTWVTSVLAMGWRVIPIYVGRQAPCSGIGVTIDPAQAEQQGKDAADNAANLAGGSAGIPAPAPIYFDMEGYNSSDATCVTAVRQFVSGWVSRLHDRGYKAGVYSSLCSGILDLAALAGNPAYNLPDAIWIAAWNDTPNLFGFGPACALRDDLWAFHQRLHQYQGGHDETWGGIAINIDTDVVDGPVFG